MIGTVDAADSVRLRLQDLPGPVRALAVGALAALRSTDDSFTTNELTDLLVDLRMPSMANMSRTLGRLRDQDLLMRPTPKTWALTPRGEAHLLDAASTVSPHSLAIAAGHVPGSELAEREHTLIPPFLGPMGSAPGLGRLLDNSAFEQNIMLITRFPKKDEQPYAELITKMQAAVKLHGLNLIIASDAMYEDTLWANVVTYMWAAKYAIVVLDTADERLNYNVLVEVGGMLMTGRRCAILRDTSVPAMPTDLVGHIYKSTDLADHPMTLDQIHVWIRDDLGLGSCGECPSSSASAS